VGVEFIFSFSERADGVRPRERAQKLRSERLETDAKCSGSQVNGSTLD
jgi:hypothetical protein